MLSAGSESTMTRVTRITVLLAAFALLSIACAKAEAQSWPTKPVKIVAPFAPGGAADTLGRIIADHLSTVFHQQFYVENRSGAGGLIGAATVATAEPDGYTLLVSGIASNVISPAFNPNPGFDGARDFVHIAYLGGPPVVLLVHPFLGAKTYKEFLAAAKASPQPMSFISPGTGTHGFLFGEELWRRENIKLTHIPYKGAGPALSDLIAGHVPVGTITFSSGAEQIRAGAVLALAVSAERRLEHFPDIPTFKELGRDDLVSDTWFGLSGPPRLPPDIVRSLSREILKIMQLPDVRQRLAIDEIQSKLMSPEAFTKYVESEAARWAPLAKSLATAGVDH